MVGNSGAGGRRAHFSAPPRALLDSLIHVCPRILLSQSLALRLISTSESLSANLLRPPNLTPLPAVYVLPVAATTRTSRFIKQTHLLHAPGDSLFKISLFLFVSFICPNSDYLFFALCQREPTGARRASTPHQQRKLSVLLIVSLCLSISSPTFLIQLSSSVSNGLYALRAA